MGDLRTQPVASGNHCGTSIASLRQLAWQYATPCATGIWEIADFAVVWDHQRVSWQVCGMCWLFLICLLLKPILYLVLVVFQRWTISGNAWSKQINRMNFWSHFASLCSHDFFSLVRTLLKCSIFMFLRLRWAIEGSICTTAYIWFWSINCRSIL